MTGPRLLVEAPAATELLEAIEYLEEQRPNLGLRFEAVFWATIDRVIAFPGASPPLGENLRRCRIRGFRYTLVYEPTPELVRVIALQHDARRPGYWRERLGAGDR